MVSKNSLKYIKSLQIKKYRQQEQCFTVEGLKSITETAFSSLNIRMVAGTADFFAKQAHLFNSNVVQIPIGTKELSSISSFKTNDSAIAVVEMPGNHPLRPEEEWILLLDGVRDPGNLGTILRVCDWYGIKKVICSEDTVEVYNPKCISSSMGSFTRVKVFYTRLEDYIKDLSIPLFGTFLEGDSIHEEDFPEAGALVLGSESHGIRKEVSDLILKRITIPSFGEAESLNVAMATAIIMDNIRRALS